MSNLPSIQTLVGSLIEVFGADLFNVLGLSIQKIAVMKIIETNRLRSALESSCADDELYGVDLTPILGESNSEVMTVASERSQIEADELNDTQVPDISDLVKSPLWLFGLVVFIMGNLSELLALSFASQTDIALLTNFALIWNAIVSVVIFKEEFNIKPVFREWSYRVVKRWDLFHCIVLLIGSMIAVYCTPVVPEDDLDSKELLHRWTDPPYSYWGAFMLCAMFFTALFLVKNWRNLKTGNLNAALIAGLCGFMSAFCVTLSKVATTLISNTIKGKNQFGNPEAVFLVTLWAVMLVCQLLLLNVALGAFEQGVVIPIYEIVGTIAAIVSGILFYRTFEDFTEGAWIGFGFGVVLMCWGVWLVAHREVHTQQELSNNLYANLSAVDDLLRVTNFSRYANEDGYVPFVGTRSAALDELDTQSFGPPLDESTRHLYNTADGVGRHSETEDAYEYNPLNLVTPKPTKK